MNNELIVLSKYFLTLRPLLIFITQLQFQIKYSMYLTVHQISKAIYIKKTASFSVVFYIKGLVRSFLSIYGEFKELSPASHRPLLQMMTISLEKANQCDNLLFVLPVVVHIITVSLNTQQDMLKSVQKLSQLRSKVMRWWHGRMYSSVATANRQCSPKLTGIMLIMKEFPRGCGQAETDSHDYVLQ